ncbi:SpoIIE family protein phosphatase [Streptomyces sp. S3(2020)]|uniref:ATP-binding SpoIIE family protein phosphatase n=1 Tax=Streptomyces sp. S3(2020) TaxID=2732044 RepID=UPI001488AC06|nr:ATP-binding SpoIIE family protein phosphatase [Streptomyces sp. S3(2020)]NNN31063.1 SpoIIE family protein phosphatase [Streptomyces sp. S3(2020)]
MPRVWDVPVHDSTRIRDARVAAEHAATLAGLDEARTAAAALVTTELATNLLKHAKGGRLLLDVVPGQVPADGGDPSRLVQIAAIDHGPGIPDVTAALRDGFTTTRSLGAGLGTCRRVADAFAVHSAPGRGTVALARIGPAGRDTAPETGGPRADGLRADGLRAGGVNLPFGGAEHSGDAWAWARSGDRVTLLLADGLGHGSQAAHASTAAVQALRGSAHLAPAELLRQLDTALRGTRGAAVAVAQVDTGTGTLRFAGLGNVGAWLWEADAWHPLLSRPGIAGVHRPRTLPEDLRHWGTGQVLLLHSDGLPSRQKPPSAPDLLFADPALMAAVTLRDSGSAARPARDDTAVAVLTRVPEEGR